MLVYPKGSSLGCLKRLSLCSGVLQIFTSVITILGTLLCALITAVFFILGDQLLDLVVSYVPNLLTGFEQPVLDSGASVFSFAPTGTDFMLDGVRAMLSPIFMYGGYICLAVTVVVLLFSILAVRRSTTHLGRSKMLKLYPSDSGLRVYKYQLVPTIFAVLVSAGLFAGLFLIDATISISFYVVFGIVFLAALFDLFTWIYMTVNFNKMMEEV